MKIDTSYFIVHKWMLEDLKLKTVERDVFAVIFGFSKDGETKFNGSLSYLASLTGYSRNSICTALKNLVEKGYIIKTEKDFNGIKQCKYHVDLYTVQATCTGIQATCTGIQATCTNNIYNNTNNKKESISKDIDYTKNFGFGKKSEPKSSLYNQCIAFIYSYQPSDELTHILIEYLNFRLSVKEKPLYSSTMWNGMLRKLFEFPDNQQIDIVKQSIELGYLSFYPLKSTNNKTRLSEPTNGTGCEQATEEDDRRRAEFIRKTRAEGKRTEF